MQSGNDAIVIGKGNGWESRFQKAGSHSLFTELEKIFCTEFFCHIRPETVCRDQYNIGFPDLLLLIESLVIDLL
jgi:hypothetical protein